MAVRITDVIGSPASNLKDVERFFNYYDINIQGMRSYVSNNLYSLKYTTNTVMVELFKRGIIFFLNNQGDFCYRTSLSGKIYCIPLSKAKIIVSTLYGAPVDIIMKPNKKIVYGSYININELAFVQDTVFNPLESEFFLKDNVIFQNTFIPTSYMLFDIYHLYEPKQSPTLQYIYYLSNYNKNKFYFIMSWLAKFFKDLSSNDDILVLIGDKESGKEIFFDDIIMPLFGFKYCLTVNDALVESNDFNLHCKEQLFYRLDNLSLSQAKSPKKYEKLLVSITNRYSRTLITTDTGYLPIDLKYFQYTVIKVPDSIEKEYFNKQSPNQPITKDDLKLKILFDLNNFAMILQRFNVKAEYRDLAKDDRDYVQSNLEDKLKRFHKALTSKEISYFNQIKGKDIQFFQELDDDFKQSRIKQKNIFQCITYIYPEENLASSRTLMFKLRNVDKKFYNTDALIAGTGGVKYFIIPS